MQNDTPQTEPSYDRAGLISNWQRSYGGKPPKGLSRQTLELALAYERQARRHGGLPKDTVRQLHKMAGIAPSNALPTLASRQVKPGARLVRQWRGKPYVVDILESGYLWQEKIYGSLSEIARAITGAHWSGPRFFGVKA